jgi:hypothetical protein
MLRKLVLVGKRIEPQVGVLEYGHTFKDHWEPEGEIAVVWYITWVKIPKLSREPVYTVVPGARRTPFMLYTSRFGLFGLGIRVSVYGAFAHTVPSESTTVAVNIVFCPCAIAIAAERQKRMNPILITLVSIGNPFRRTSCQGQVLLRLSQDHGEGACMRGVSSLIST